MPELSVTAPAPLRADHLVADFSCQTHEALDHWLRERALTSEGLSARTYVICARDEPQRVAGYYTITTAQEHRAVLPSAKPRKGQPDRVPLLLIARLAVDARWQGMGLGADLLADALRRCLAASGIAGARAVIVHAMDDAAASFYERYGFCRSPLGELTLVLPIETVRAIAG